MVGVLRLLAHLLLGLFKSPAQLQAENTVLRHQLNVLSRSAPKKLHLTAADRLLFVWLLRMFPSIRGAIQIVQPDTVLRWHRRGFRSYWRWKSRSLGGRPRIPAEIRQLIREMSLVNPLWGAPRIHGELLKLGNDVAQSTVAKYIWHDMGADRHRPGGHSCATTRLASPQWISWWCRPLGSGCCSPGSCSNMTADSSCCSV